MSSKPSFTDANGQTVTLRDRVEYQDGRQGQIIDILQDGDGVVIFDGADTYETVKWVRLCKAPATKGGLIPMPKRNPPKLPPVEDRGAMSLRTAKAIARKVGATIKHVGDQPPYEVRLGVPAPEGLPTQFFYASSPREAAHFAVIETAKACHVLIVEAKKIFVQENLLFDGGL